MSLFLSSFLLFFSEGIIVIFVPAAAFFIADVVVAAITVRFANVNVNDVVVSYKCWSFVNIAAGIGVNVVVATTVAFVDAAVAVVVSVVVGITNVNVFLLSTAAVVVV